MSDLPPNWVACTIGDVTTSVEKTGKDDPDRDIWYIDISSIDNSINMICEPKRLRLSEAPSRARLKVRVGDVLFSTVSPALRKIAFVPERYDGEIASTGFAVLRPDEGIEPKFLFYKSLSQEFVSALKDVQYGVIYPAVNEKQVRAQPLQLPPTNEQRRIVAKIDELFSELDNGVENLKLVRKQLKFYRHSVLKHAFEGGLTADWRKSNQEKLETHQTILARIQEKRDTRYMQKVDEWNQQVSAWRANGEEGRKPRKPKPPATIANEIDDPRVLPYGWASTPLGMIIDEPIYGTSKKCSYNAQGWGVLRIPNLSNGIISLDDMKYAQFSDVEREKYNLEAGDLLIIRSNGSITLVGSVAVIETGHTELLYAGYLVRLSPNRAIIDSRYLLYVMQSHDLRQQIETKAKSTSGVNNINTGEIKTLNIPICNLEEQKEIARRLDAVLSNIDATSVEIDVQLNNSYALRQSILKRAFCGQLVSPDPSDEAASILLDRIKGRKEVTVPKRRRRTRA